MNELEVGKRLSVWCILNPPLGRNIQQSIQGFYEIFTQQTWPSHAPRVVAGQAHQAD